MYNKFFSISCVCVFLLACCNFLEPVVNGVQMRILNNTDIDFENVSVNDVSFGFVERYEASEYKEFDELYRYGAISITTIDTTYWWGVLDYFGEIPLDEGYYTYMLSVDFEHSSYYLTLVEGNNIPGKSQPKNKNRIIEETYKYISNSGLEDTDGGIVVAATKRTLQTINPTISNVPNTHVRYLEDAYTFNAIINKLLIKTDNSGNELWRKSIPIDYYLEDNFKILQSSNRNFILAGSCEIFTADGYNVRAVLAKFDPKGEYLWSRTYGTGYSGVNDLIEKNDGTYILTGVNNYDNTWLINISADGDEISNINLSTRFHGESITDVQDGFVIVGDKYGDGGDVNISGIVKIDFAWNELWTIPIYNAAVLTVIESSDSSLVVVGHERHETAIILKFNSDGSLIWRKKILHDEPFVETRAYSVVQSIDDNYIVSGMIGENNALFKIDNNGIVIWSRSFDKQFDLVYPNYNMVINTMDNNILLISTNDNKVFLAKVSQSGDIIFESEIGE